MLTNNYSNANNSNSVHRAHSSIAVDVKEGTIGQVMIVRTLKSMGG